MKDLSKNLLYEIENEPRRRPYAARVDFLLGEDVELSFEYPACLLSTSQAILQMRLAPEQPMGPLQHLKKFRIEVAGFTKASEAEAAGLHLAIALLWAAVSKRFTMRLDYHTTLPCIVYDRTISSSGGVSLSGFAKSYWPLSTHDFAELLEEDVLDYTRPVDQQLLLSMELFAAARLEVSDRARFISLVSSLEPLALSSNNPESIQNLISAFEKQLESVEVSELPMDEISILKNSLKGRLEELRKESIRQVILRVVRELLPGDRIALKIIDDAYSLRSNILHEGIIDPYLDRKVVHIEGIIRRMYASKIGKDLKVPAA